MIPFYFDQCFGWFHPARSKRGVVICPAFGVEELCTHRFMRQLAEQLAAAGLPTLRFDYHGTGNSAGSDLDEARVEHWLGSIRAAMKWLQENAGVSEIALIGFRLGALLATEIARESGDVLQLALIAPPVSGKTHLREMKALSALIAQSTRADAASQTSGGESLLEVAGFLVTRETSESLRQIDLLALQKKPAEHVLVLGRADAVNDERLTHHFRELGSQVERKVLPGYAEMEWNSTVASLPGNAFDELVDWMARDLLSSVQNSASYSLSHELRTETWHEDTAEFGNDVRLFGIRCRPTVATKSTAVLFVNHGSNHHIGWARMFVQLARRLAAQGVTSLRMDIAGIGDSPAHPGQTENQLYYRGSQRDVYAALDWLQQQGYGECAVVGHCAGAHLGFFSATHDQRISKLVLLNLQRFFWKRGDSLQVAMRNGFRSSSWYLANAFDFTVWRRLFRGDINVRGITKALMQRLVKRYGRSNAVANPASGQTQRQKVLSWFRQFQERGTDVLLVYSAEDGGLDEIALHGGRNARKIRKLPNVQFRIIDGADHNITAPSAFEEYAQILEEYLVRT